MCTSLMLTNLLPGLRDLRAPLSAGYLWLAAGWLFLAPQLPASVDDAQGVLKDIYRVVDASDPITVLAGLTFVAYILGILSNMLTRPIRFIALVPFYVLVGPLILIAILLHALSERRPVIRSRFDDVLAGSRRWQRRNSPKSPILNVENLVLHRLASNVLRDESFRAFLLLRLERERLAKILSGPYALGKHGLRRLQSIRLLLDNPHVDNEEKAREILSDLSKYIQEGYLDAAEALVETLVDVEHHARDIRDELTLVPQRLVSDRPATYERWDRLRAEGEFRLAVVAPLYAIVAALVARGVLSMLYVLVLLLPPAILLVQGVSKEDEAEGQLIQVLQAGITSTDAMDRLMTRDLYFYR
jgi:hypothetical protein